MRNYIVVGLAFLICSFAIASEEITESISENNVEGGGANLPQPRAGCTYNYYGGGQVIHQSCDINGLIPTLADVNGGACLVDCTITGKWTSASICKKISKNSCDKYVSSVDEDALQCGQACMDYHAHCCCPPKFVPGTDDATDAFLLEEK